MPRDRAPCGRPPTAEDLEGFLAGLRALAESRRRAGEPDATASPRLEEGARLLALGRLAEAEAALRSAEERFAERTPEVELVEFPRGLVGYVPAGQRGAPPEREEDQLSNRLLLVQRLVTVRRREGGQVDELVARLNEAESAYLRGERTRARRLVDSVQDDLDRTLGETRAGREP